MEGMYEDSRLFEANQIMLSIFENIQLYLNNENISESEKKQLIEMNESMENNPLIQNIKNDIIIVEKIYDHFKVDSEWERVKETSDNITISYKRIDDTYHMLKSEGIMDANIFSIASVILELDLFHLWIPKFLNMGLLYCNEIARINKFKKIGHLEIGLPWPLKNRDCLCIGFGVDLLDKGQILIAIYSISEYPTYDLPQIRPKIPRMDIIEAGCLLTPLNEEQTKVELIGHFDPKVDYIPEKLTNWVMKELIAVAFRLFSKRAKNIGKKGCPYKERIDNNPDVYDYLAQRLKLFYSEKSNM
jgi:hypothetical protein